MSKPMSRCPWAEGSPENMVEYHDTEWGVPSRDDAYLFEMLILEGAQAGLSWSTVLNKRENYRRAFARFEFEKVARFSDEHCQKLLEDPGIIRNRLKVFGAVRNAKAFSEIADEFGTFAAYLWGRVEDEVVDRRPQSGDDVPTSDALSDAISKDLKKRGMTFVGSTIMYSYLQAVGVVNDHLMQCPYGNR